MDRPWDGTSTRADACGCGAGAPCPVCWPEAACAGYSERERGRIAAWLLGLEENYSGWNDHDEHFDRGWNGAIKWVAESIAKRLDIASTAGARSDETALAGSGPQDRQSGDGESQRDAQPEPGQ